MKKKNRNLMVAMLVFVQLYVKFIEVFLLSFSRSFFFSFLSCKQKFCFHHIPISVFLAPLTRTLLQKYHFRATVIFRFYFLINEIFINERNSDAIIKKAMRQTYVLCFKATIVCEIFVLFSILQTKEARQDDLSAPPAAVHSTIRIRPMPLPRTFCNFHYKTFSLWLFRLSFHSFVFIIYFFLNIHSVCHFLCVC